jgi:long-chain acyl-CoA synthetase
VPQTTTDTAPLRTAIEEALTQPTLCAAFQHTAAAHRDRPALEVVGEPPITWGEYAERVRRIAGGLWSLGVRRGDSVALLLANRPEFHIADAAAIHLGATPFSIYHTNPAEQIVPLLANSGARVVITEAAFAARIAGARELGADVEHLVLLEGGDDGLSFAELEAREPGDGFDFEQSWRAVAPEDIATLVYTSGTTGAPKGVQHTHGGLVFGLRSIDTLCRVSPGGRVVSYLPMAHIAERYVSHYGSMAFGYHIGCCPDPANLPATLAAIRPTRLFGVPRIFEKLRDAMLGAIEKAPEAERGAMQAALERSLVAVRETHDAGRFQEGLAPCTEPAELAPVRALVGLDAAEWIAVAAAPTPLEVLVFFHALGLPITELWGMSETVLSTSNIPGRVHLGTVGLALPGVEVRLAEDGEILVRGPQVTPGYRGDPERTREALDEEHWMHSGDVASAGPDGYLQIIDRKKELIINSAGKNMSPAHIETTLKEESRLLAHVVAIGDGRPYVTALIVLDGEAVRAFAAQRGLAGAEIADLAGDPAVVAEVAQAVERGNARLARVEQVKRHVVLAEEWVPGSDVLTPTQKLRRRPIGERYAEQIGALYTA